MPSWLTREQYREDSLRAIEWFKLTKDSAYIQKYVFENITVPFKNDKKKNNLPKRELMIAMAEDKNTRKIFLN